jgi:hypothetical protein
MERTYEVFAGEGVERVPDYLGEPSEDYMGQGEFAGARTCQEISEAIGRGNAYVYVPELRAKLGILPCVTLAEHPELLPEDEEDEEDEDLIDDLFDRIERLEEAVQLLLRRIGLAGAYAS